MKRIEQVDEVAGVRITSRTIERLTEVILGGPERSPYRTGRALVEFFRDFGERDLYAQVSFPGRANYVREKLRKFNGTETLERIVSAAFDFIDEDCFDAEGQAAEFNRTRARDGYRLALEYRRQWMEGDRRVEVDPYFEVQSLSPSPLVPEGLAAISHAGITEQVSKANARLSSGDHAGAIASSYTLVEDLLKLILREAGVAFKENEGDIRKLYGLARGPLNLDPSGEGIAGPLKPILDGLQKLVSGLFEVSNKASDRHARRYNPAARHARLAVSAAFALCEFLVASRDYQRDRDSGSKDVPGDQP